MLNIGVSGKDGFIGGGDDADRTSMLAPEDPQFESTSPGAEHAPDRGYANHLADWFSGLSTATFFVSLVDLTVVDPNEAATALFETPGEPSRVNGRLSLGGRSGTDLFRRFLDDLGPRAAIYAHGSDAVRILIRAERISDGPMVALQVFDTASDGGLWADTGAIFGLTKAEDRLVKRLIGGANIEQLSDGLGISVETARTHVRRSYQKIGVSNREQLFAALSPFRLRG